MSTQVADAKTADLDPTAAVKKPIAWRDPIAAAVMTVLTAILIFFSHGESKLSFAAKGQWAELPHLTVPSALSVTIMTLIALAFTIVIWVRALQRKNVSGWWLVGVGVAFVLGFIIWTVAGVSGTMYIVPLLAGALSFAVPLTFGALSGAICERSGVINIAIEGQLLFGAFASVMVASIAGSAWFGLIGAPIAGVLVGALLALFTVNFRADHIIVGVVINMLIVGLTSFLFSTVMRANPEHLNQAMVLQPIRIPVLAGIPIIGPVLFNQNILVYIMYLAVFFFQYMFFRSRWGLRTRACGEHPRAADTVGIKVNRTRWLNVMLAGGIAGLGGAFFTIGQDLAFTKDMAAGNGFIALAAMILGRWNPKGAFAASLLFGFATNLRIIMGSVGSSLPPEFLNMVPYLVTILAVAGFVGAVRPPAAEGKPYP